MYRRLAVAVVVIAAALPAWAPAVAAPASPARPAGVARRAAPAKKPVTGALRIRVTGLPSGVRAAVRITGSNRYRKTVSRTRTLRRLTPGIYRVRTLRVSTPRGAATGKPSKRRVKVRAGRTRKVAAKYVWAANPPPTTTALPDTTPPGPVGALTATDRTPGSITLSWTNPADADLAAVIVRRAKGATAPGGPGDGTGVVLGAPMATGVIDSGLDPDTSYSYAVFARDAVGNTSAPATLTASTTALPDTTAPGPVGALTATDRTPGSITLSWTNPADADLAAVIVRRAKGATAPAGPGDGTGVVLGAPTATGVTDSGLDPDTSYSYAVFTRDAAGNTSAPATLTASTTASPQVYSVFNYPQPGRGDPTIREELVRLLNQVPSGAQVEASFFIITPNYPVVDALINAYDRGAAVRVVLDSGDRQGDSTNALMDATYQRLFDELGGDTSASSFAMQCTQACISKEDDSIQHNKFVLMSTTGDLDDVVFETTSNMRPGGSGDTTWNAAVVSSDNHGVYDSFRGYFEDLAARWAVPRNDYNAFRPPVTYGKLTPYYFPRTDGTDTVAQTLASVDCSTAPTVDVMATQFVRTQVRDRLTQMAQAGCRVRVISRADNISRSLCDSLVSGSVDVKIGDAPSDTAVGIHGKYLTVTGGVGDSHLVWMGSHNLTDNALLRNDETFVLIDDQAVHDAFGTNFETIWGDSSMSAGCAKVL